MSVFAIHILVVSLLMTYIWKVSEKNKNAGIVDVAWAGSFLISLGLYALLLKAPPFRKWLILVIAGTWCIRLTLHLWLRYKKDFPKEDPRYHALREKWGAQASKKMLKFFLFQGLTTVGLSIPFFLAFSSPFLPLSSVETLGAIIAVLGILGEGLSDIQLARFKASGAGVCNVGLWRMSRHPNYFFEWMTWCGFSLLAWQHPYFWIAFLSPIAIFVLLYFCSGIPPAEERRSKNPEYRAYMDVTNAFVPGFPPGPSRTKLWVVALVLCLTLGLAPYSPPHVLQKAQWLGRGYLALLRDWLDFFMHGLPWVFLVLLILSPKQKTSRAAG